MGTKRMAPFLPAIAFLYGIALSAFAAGPAVDLTNESAMAVSVPLGTDNGVSADSDFHIAADNVYVAIYPQELFRDRFWSQPLSDEEYFRIKSGMEVVRASLDPVTHGVLRAKGEVRRSEILARQEEARRQFILRKIEDFKGKRETLRERRDALDERITSVENVLAGEEGRMEWVMNSEDERIDQALRAIQDLADKRDELQAQREALSRTSSRSDVARQSTEIARLSDRIGLERDAIRSARERKASARAAYMSRKQEWQKLAAERRELRSEVRSIDQKIKDLEERK